MTPIVELSFMPAILAGCTWISPRTGRVVNPGKVPCKTHMQYKGVTEHPQNWSDWHNLVKALVQHAVDNFGMAEVEKWRFEVWNEMWGMDFPDPYMTLYNASATAVKSVGSSLRIGGPATARLGQLADFMVAAKAVQSIYPEEEREREEP